MPTQQKLGNYALLREAGRGGMSTVFEATDTQLGRTVAVKILSVPPHLLPEDRAAMVARIKREAQALARLSHPNVVTIYTVGEQDGLHYLVMEFLHGQTLRARLDDGPLKPAEAAAVLSQVAEGLDAVHGIGVVHRDVKPSNVMLMPDNRVKLMDFGVARNADDTTMTRTGTMVGSPAYMAPELIRGEGATPASDIWALGVLLYEMLAGRSPFAGDSIPAVLYRIAHEEPAPMPGVSRAVATVLRRALAKDPAKRFPTARVLADAYRDAITPSRATAPAAAPPPPRVPARDPAPATPDGPTIIAPPPRGSGARRRSPVLLTLAALLLLLGIGFAASHLARPGGRGRETAVRVKEPPAPVRAANRDATKPLEEDAPSGPARSAAPGPPSKTETPTETPAEPARAHRRPDATREDAKPAPTPRPRRAPERRPRVAATPPAPPAPTPERDAAPPSRPRRVARANADEQAPVRPPVPRPERAPQSAPPVVRSSEETPVDVQEAEPPVPAPPTPSRPAPQPEAPAPADDARAELTDLLQSWIAATNANDIDQQMALYQPRLATFYTARNTSRAAVRREKVRVFGRASVIRMSASEPAITVSPDGRSAVMRFRKRFVIERPGADRRGEVLSELRWQRTGGAWKIVSERDLRVSRRSRRNA